MVSILKSRTGFDAVGIRLKKENDFPYFFQEGFSEEFLSKENTIVECDEDGKFCEDTNCKICLECTCGLVVSGKTISSHPLFTESGSFWTNNSMPLLDLSIEDDPRHNPRNECMHQNYASIALVPIRSDDEIVGLIQFNDKQINRFTIEIVQMMEDIAAYVGSAISRKQAEKLFSEKREAANRKLKAREEYLFTILSTVQSGIVLIDKAEAAIKFVNFATTDMIGFPRDMQLIKQEIVGQKYFHFLKIDLDENVQGFESFESASVFEGKEGTLISLEGIAIPIVYNVSFMTFEERELFVVSFTNMSEMKKTQDELKKAKVIAEAANIAKSQFLSNMSHEIRTPMNGILGACAVLLEMNLTKKQHEFVTMLNSSGHDLMQIIGNILDFSKIEAGKMDVENFEFDLVEILQDRIKLLSLHAFNNELDLICKIDKDLPARFIGDGGKLIQVVTNLVGNALKFTKNGNVIVDVSILATEKSINSDNVKIIFKVQDTGIGIPASKCESIFKPFVQADGSTTRKYGGTGLGLTISRQLVELMGGEIGVESAEGKGSTFWFTVALVRAADDESAFQFVENKNIQKGIKRKRHILLVEDDLTSRIIAVSILEKIGYHVDFAINGLEAVKKLEAEKYDLVFMDHLMPIMDGLAATATIRSEESKVLNHDVIIIALTANAMKSDREKCLKAGMNDYLSKPLMVNELNDMLQKWLA